MRTWRTLIGAGFALCILVMSGCGNSVQEPDYSKKVGEKGVLESSGQYTQVTVDEAAFNELVKARIAKDKAGQMQLVQAGRLFYAKNGVRVLVIDSSFAKRKIRILEGEHSGRAGWVYVENVR